MGDIFVNGEPLESAESFLAESKNHNGLDDARKFFMVHKHPELHITACAVSRMEYVDLLPEAEGYYDYKVEPNREWREWREEQMRARTENPKTVILMPDWAWVKVYRRIDRELDSVIKGRVQTITIPMEFFGESVNECWADLQFLIKQTNVRNGKLVRLENVKIGRHRSFDPRVGQWVEETKPIEPKLKRDKDGKLIDDPRNKNRYYISIRLYHQNHKPKEQPDWRFEPVYVSVAGEDLYRVDVIWQDEKIVITAILLDDDSPEIPQFLRR